MQFSVRSLEQPDELARCAEMMLRANPWDKLYFTFEQCNADLANPALDIYGAMDDDGQLLGFMATMSNGIGFEPMIEYLCVDEPFRNAGVGSGLIEHFETTLFPDDDNVYLFVSDINPNAIRLYERLGFERIGTLPHFNLVDQTEYLYRKSRRPKQEQARLASQV